MSRNISKKNKKKRYRNRKKRGDIGGIKQREEEERVVKL